jgi:hypothetical protein
MNERIRELLKQSTNPPWDGEQGPMNEFNLERFAELIVKECAGVAEVSMPINSHPDYRLTVKNNVLKHFGVEE